MTQRFFLHNSFVYRYSSASLKYFITRTPNLFITVTLLAKGCVSFCCSHPSFSKVYCSATLEKECLGRGFRKCRELSQFFPLEKNPEH